MRSWRRIRRCCSRAGARWRWGTRRRGRSWCLTRAEVHGDINRRRCERGDGNGGQADAFVEIAGLRLHYREYGDPAAPPLVCLHGVAMEAHGWDRFAAHVGDRNRVLALTARGHGDSDRAERVRPNAAYRGQCGVHRCACRRPCYGMRTLYGGGTAIGLAAMHPDRSRKADYRRCRSVQPGRNGAAREGVRGFSRLLG